jgi:hypothetical protein
MVPVLVIKEDGRAIDPALGHMQRLVGQYKARATGHGQVLA